MKIKEAITKAAEEIIGYKKWKNRKWLRTWNDEIQFPIEEKKASNRKYLQNKTVEHYIEYKKHRAIVRKTTRRQRRDDWDKFVKTMERDITGTQRDVTGTQRDVTGTQRDTKTKSMVMCGNHTQRVKIVINDNIIEQVTDFKYLWYPVSEYKSDLEDKLQKYNKINGAIRRHFAKQMNKETKLRIHNITANAKFKFESEAWVLKKREEQRLEAAQMKFLRQLL